jgi:hypothetical protein
LGAEAHLRRIEIWLEDKQDTMVFLTNNMKLAASTIAAIYKERWQIELFFKALKQSLKIKTFVGTTENAVQTQIWTALISMLMIKYLQMKSTFNWSLSNLVALLRQQLFVYRDLFTWLNDPYQAPPALAGLHDAQMTLVSATNSDSIERLPIQDLSQRRRTHHQSGQQDLPHTASAPPTRSSLGTWRSCFAP